MALALCPDRQYTAPSAADSVVLTPNAVAWAPSVWVPVLASTPAACVLTGITVVTLDTGSMDAEIDVATGTPGAEVLRATLRVFLRAIASVQAGPSCTVVLPIPVDTLPAGVPIAVRLRKSGTSVVTWRVAVTYLQQPLTSTLLLTHGVPTTLPAGAAGVTITSSATVWADGAWVSLRAATGAALVVTGIVFGTPSANADFELDLGTGAAGLETVITTVRIAVSNQAFPSVVMLPLPLDNVPAATRLAARLRCGTGGSTQTMLISVNVIEQPL